MPNPKLPNLPTVSDAFKQAIERFPTASVKEVKQTVPVDAASWRELVQQRNA